MLYNMRRGGSYGPRLCGPARSVSFCGRALSFLARPLRAVAGLCLACCRVVGVVPCASVGCVLSPRLCSSARLPACRDLLPRFAWPFEGGGAAALHHAGLRRRLRRAFHEERKSSTRNTGACSTRNKKSSTRNTRACSTWNERLSGQAVPSDYDHQKKDH